MGNDKKDRVSRWRITKLKDHPHQAEMFGDVDEAELAALAENMRTRGQLEPVEVTPDGTVIAGHQRLRAARQIGWIEIDVVVRYDLAEKGEAAIEERFIEDNFVRRQLSPLTRARCIRRLMELEAGRAAHQFGMNKREQLKARIAFRMKLSPRSVSRYLLLLNAPQAVQQAFDRGNINLTVAGRIALLPEETQFEVARRIEAGEKPTAVIAKLSGVGEPADAGKAFIRLMSCLRREIPVLEGQASRVNPGRLSRSEPTIRQAIATLAEFVVAGGGQVS